MSAIEKSILQVTKADPAKRGEDQQAYLGRLLIAVAKLSDADWAKIGKPAQGWYNSAADVKNDNKEKKRSDPLPDFPDAEKDEKTDDDAPRSRRRKADDEPAQEERLTKVGDIATVLTKRGREYTGEVVEISDAIIVLKGDGGEDEFDMEKVESVTVQHGDAGDGGDDGDAQWEPAVGDSVELTTKRGKTYTGEIVEIDDKIVVLKGKDGEDEFDMDKVGGIALVGGNEPPADDDAPRSRRGSPKDEDEQPSRRGGKADEAKDADDGKKTRSSNPRGVSVGGRIRELMCEDMAITPEEIGKILKKEAIEFRETSLNMIYKDTKTVFDLLKQNKKLK